MYIPSFFVENDRDLLLTFMRDYNFATVVTAENGVAEASHLPFIIEERDSKIILCAHMAMANQQWKHFGDDPVLVIFQEPHAYVSPLHYEEMQNVPTWNYVAIHAYGRAKIIKSVEENIRHLEKMIAAFDKEYFEGNWQKIPDEYKTRQAEGIVAFEIEVTDLQGKKKLNQNKTGQDARNVIAALEKSYNGNERQIAKYMKEVHGED